MDRAGALACLLCDSKYAVVFTGAGMSTESGLPDFRSPSGLWRKQDPMKVATINVLRTNPQQFYEFYRARLAAMEKACPNAAHFAVKELEERGLVKTIITQNIDGLHQKAGSRSVVELHGNLREAVCLDCRRLHPIEDLKRSDVPRCEGCGGPIKPNVILFGEALPEESFDLAIREAAKCDLMIVIGSSLEVSPANMLPAMVKSRGMKVAVLNLGPTQFDSRADLVIQGKAGEILSQVVALVAKSR